MRKAFRLAVAAMVATATSASAAPPPGKGPALLPPAAAQAAMDAPGTTTISPAVPATPGQVAQAMHRPGAINEGVLPMGTVTTTAARKHVGRSLASVNGCWQRSGSHTWGTWWTGYGQKLTDSTYWCVSNGALSTRSTTITQDQVFCDRQGVYSSKLAGGIGWSAVEYRDGGYWSCPTNIPFYSISRNDWMNVEVGQSALYSIYAWS